MFESVPKMYKNSFWGNKSLKNLLFYFQVSFLFLELGKLSSLLVISVQESSQTESYR